MVILGHIQIPYMLKTVIYSFHMPLFFFVSGCFFRPISLREFFAKKTRQLLIPWAFFAFLLFAYLFVLTCGGGTVLRIDELQADGGKRMKAADYLRGHPIPVG